MPASLKLVVCGSDGLAIRVVEELAALGQDVVVVAGDGDCPLARHAVDAGMRPVLADFRREATLRGAGVGQAAALALLEDDDVGNIGAALAAQELNPGVHLVVRMFNVALGRSLELLFEDCRILSATALAAPAFAQAAIHGHTGQSVRVLGRTLEVLELDADDPRLVAALTTRPSSGDEELFPDGGGPVLGLAEPAEPDRARRARQAATLRRRLGARMSGLAALFERRLALLLAVLLAILAISTAVFERSQDLGWVDAVYFAITTVLGGSGYGDVHLADAGAGVKLYGAGVMIFGALTVTILFALVADAIVGARLARTFGSPPLPTRDHVIVCGLGNIGFRVVERLVACEVPCIAVEQEGDGRFVGAARRLGVPVVIADASQPQTLAVMRLAGARCLMAVTSDDIANLETALAARAVRPDLRIVLRLFDTDLAERVERTFGIHISRSVAALAAPAFVAALLSRRLIGVLGIGHRVLAVSEVAVMAGSRAARRTVAELERGCECRVLAIGDRFAPAGSDPVSAERLTVVASRAGLRRLSAEALVSPQQA